MLPNMLRPAGARSSTAVVVFFYWCCCGFLRHALAATYTGPLSITSPCGNYTSPTTRITIPETFSAKALDISISPLPPHLEFTLTSPTGGFVTCKFSVKTIPFTAKISKEEVVLISTGATDSSRSKSASSNNDDDERRRTPDTLLFMGGVDLVTASSVPSGAPKFVFATDTPGKKESDDEDRGGEGGGAPTGRGTIVGIVIAGVSAVVAVVGLLWWCLVRRRRRQEKNRVYPELAYVYNPVPAPTPTPSGRSAYTAESWEMEGDYPGGWVEGKGGKGGKPRVTMRSLGAWGKGRWR